MKKLFKLLLCSIFALALFAACDKKDTPIDNDVPPTNEPIDDTTVSNSGIAELFERVFGYRADPNYVRSVETHKEGINGLCYINSNNAIDVIFYEGDVKNANVLITKTLEAPSSRDIHIPYTANHDHCPLYNGMSVLASDFTCGKFTVYLIYKTEAIIGFSIWDIDNEKQVLIFDSPEGFDHIVRGDWYGDCTLIETEYRAANDNPIDYVYDPLVKSVITLATRPSGTPISSTDGISVGIDEMESMMYVARHNYQTNTRLWSVCHECGDVTGKKQQVDVKIEGSLVVITLDLISMDGGKSTTILKLNAETGAIINQE